MVWFGLFFVIIFSFIDSIWVRNFIVQGYSGLVILVCWTANIVAITKRLPTARFLLTAELCTVVGATTFMLMIQGVIDVSSLSLWSLHWGFLSEALLFSLAIAARTRLLQQSAIDRQLEAIHNLEKYENLYDDSLDALFEYNLFSGHIHYNPAFSKIFGDTRDNPLELFSASDQESLQKLLNEESKAMGYQAEYYCSTRKAHLWVSISLRMLFDDMRRPLSVEGSIRDISEIKLKEEAVRANLAKSKFLAAASHDLRQPLQAIALFTTVLKSKLADSPHHQLVEKLNQSVTALIELFNALMDISKLDAGLIVPVIRQVALENILSLINSEFAPVAKERGLDFFVAYSPVVIVETDKGLLIRILRNFVTNAVRYTQHGKISIVTILQEAQRQVTIEVHDTGKGIPSDKLQEIFTEFVQLDTGSAHHDRGLGLGLAIVKRLAMILAHPLEVKSVVGAGSVFSITIPLAAESTPLNYLPGEATTDFTACEPLHILVIDDELSILAGMKALLNEWGHTVLCAESEMIAKQQLMEGGFIPHAIITDYSLADGKNGVDAINNITALFPEEFIAAIIVTGDTSPCRLREVNDSGFQLFSKPISPDQLRIFLRKVSNLVFG